jgi:hypothetical protein
MKRLPPLLPVLSFFLAAGCANDATQPPPATPSHGLIHGEIGGADFEYVIGAAGDPDEPIDGPFVLRGSHLHYDDEVGALVVDLTVQNQGAYPRVGTVWLAFIDFIPAAVTVMNPDFDTAIIFAFADDDGVWLPGETSLPRTVQFDVAKGVSIGFTARLYIGEPYHDGIIGGIVWNDADQDGVRDDGEPGVPAVEVQLHSLSDDGRANGQDIFVRTDPLGRFEFEHLAAGMYMISRATSIYACHPTTVIEIRVLLTEADGEVVDFLDANFGCVPVATPSPPPAGAYVHVTGKYYAGIEVLVAYTLDRPDCATEPTPLDPCRFGVLRGSVAGFDRYEPGMLIMRTLVGVDRELAPPAGIHIGDRVEARVGKVRGLDTWTAIAPITAWNEPHEEIAGLVEEVYAGLDGLLHVRVLDTWLVLSGATEIEP